MLFYSMSWDAVVADLVEDPTLTVPMKLTSDGVLYVKGQYIEETKSYPGFIPSPVGTMSFDLFDYYTTNALIQDLNSGSNEWGGTTYLARWFGRTGFAGIQEYDILDSYTAGTRLSASMPGGGVGLWSGSYNYFGRPAFYGIKTFDDFSSYATGSSISGLIGGYLYGDTSVPWITEKWETRILYYGIRAYDNFSLDQTGSNITGSNSYPDSRYTNFVGPWNTRAFTTG